VFVMAVLSIHAVSAYSFFEPRYNTDDFREITEFRQTTEHRTGDYWNSQTTKRTVSEKTEVRRKTRTPTYSSYYGYPRDSYVPYSSWRFKEPYRHSNYANARYNDYYYKPRFDSNLGYYNWRW